MQVTVAFTRWAGMGGASCILGTADHLTGCDASDRSSSPTGQGRPLVGAIQGLYLIRSLWRAWKHSISHQQAGSGTEATVFGLSCGDLLHLDTGTCPKGSSTGSELSPSLSLLRFVKKREVVTLFCKREVPLQEFTGSWPDWRLCALEGSLGTAAVICWLMEEEVREDEGQAAPCLDPASR